MLSGVKEYVSVDGVNVDISNDNAAINVNISVNNLSEFSFASYIAIKKIQVGEEYAQLYSGSTQFSGTFQRDDFPVFSSKLVQFRFNWPGGNVSSLQDYLVNNESWTFVIRMLINTVINEDTPITLDFIKMYPQ